MVLQKALGRGWEFLEKHPLIIIKEGCAGLMRDGISKRSLRVSYCWMIENATKCYDGDSDSDGYEYYQ